MSKKKILFALISAIILIAVQVYFLSKYDHFKAEGGLKVELSMDPNDVPRKYARASDNYDLVMEDAIREHKKSGGDFLATLAKSNKKQMGQRLVHLFNYREIEGLSLSSTDDEVIALLKENLDYNLQSLSNYFEGKMNRVLNKNSDVNFSSEELTLTIKVAGEKDSLGIAFFQIPKVELGFYECFGMGKLFDMWNKACLFLDADSEEESELMDLNAPQVDKRTLANSVEWINGGVGFVKEEDRQFVEEMLSSPELEGVFPDNLEFRWSLNTEQTDQGDVWKLYAIKIPKDGKPTISNQDIKRAQIQTGVYGEPVLEIEMTPEGTEKWAIMTEENVGRIIAMCINGLVISAPNVNSPILAGRTELSAGDGSDLKEIEDALNMKTAEIRPIDVSMSLVDGNPPMLNALVQRVLLGVIILITLFLFFKLFHGGRSEVKETS